MLKSYKFFIIFSLFSSKLLALTPFELHNINEAHQSGITGNTVHVGIIDTAFNDNHQSLRNKLLEPQILPTNENGQSYVPNFSTDTHGSHTAGTILGSRLRDDLPYGVAYNAKFYGISIFADSRHTVLPDIYNILKNKSEVKIVNNGWGSRVYPLMGLHFDANNNLLENSSIQDNTNYVVQELTNPLDETSGLYKLAKENNLLSIFTTGNDGLLSPNIQSILPRYDEEIRSLITVGALDSQYITKDANGKLILDAKAATNFSNGFKGATNFSLMAAGVNINSVDASTNNGYVLTEGTSAAAPFVSGTAALIQEKFPFLNGAQIADVLLSTANKDYEAPKMVVKEIFEGDENNLKLSYTLVYIDQDVPSDIAAQRADVEALYGSNIITINGVEYKQVDFIMANLSTVQVSQRLSKEELFGQGILDAQKALQGLSTLDANRLNLKDIQNHDNKNQAFYTLDTQGYSAEFSNDIGQKTWDNTLHLDSALNSPASQMQNINAVGLIKEGQGKLILSGTNSYEGDTIVKNGTLALQTRNDGTGGVLNSSVFVENQGILEIGQNSSSANLASNATRMTRTNLSRTTNSINISLNKDLTNQGIVQIGNDGIALLEVQGTYTQNSGAILKLSFNENANSSLQASNYNINSGASLIYSPLLTSSHTQEIALNLGGLENHLDQFNISIDDSGVLDLSLLADKMSISSKLKDNAYANYEGANTSLARVLRAFSSSTSIASSYNDFFAMLNSAENASYVNTLKSLDNNDYLKNTERIIKIQEKLSFENLLLLLQDKEDSLSFNPSYTLAKSTYYKAHAFASKLQGLKNINDDLKFSAFLNYNSSRADFDYSSIDSRLLSAGLSSSMELALFKLIGGVSLALAQNKAQRQITNQDSNIQASYNNTLASAQLGLNKDLIVYQNTKQENSNKTLKLSPMLFGSYNFAYQDNIQENQGLFNTTYKKKSYQNLNLNLGANLNYEARNQNSSNVGANFFAFYETKLLGSTMQNNAYFNDFASEDFEYKHKADTTLARIGANVYLQTKKSSFSLGLDNELSKNSNDLNINAKFQYDF